MIIYDILSIVLLLTDARAFPISSPELPGTAPRLAFGEEKKSILMRFYVQQYIFQMLQCLLKK